MVDTGPWLCQTKPTQVKVDLDLVDAGLNCAAPELHGSTTEVGDRRAVRNLRAREASKEEQVVRRSRSTKWGLTLATSGCAALGKGEESPRHADATKLRPNPHPWFRRA